MMFLRSALAAAASVLVLGLAIPAGAATQPAASGPTQILLDRGRKALDAKDFKAAITEFERALVVDPASGRTYTLLGVAHARLGNDARARKYFRSALDIDPNDVDALQNQGQLYAAAGDLGKAQENLDKIARLCGGCAQQKTLDGEIAKARAKPAKAEANPGGAPAKTGTPGG